MVLYGFESCTFTKEQVRRMEPAEIPFIGAATGYRMIDQTKRRYQRRTGNDIYQYNENKMITIND
jgi:hypothetical protein